MSKSIRIRKGLNIRLIGEAQKVTEKAENADVYAIRPPNFHGVVPKMLVKAGENIKAGSPLFYSKINDKIKFCSPVSGEVTEIVRGEKRRILEVRILPDSTNDFVGQKTWSGGSREDLLETLLSNGLWPFVKQRPYDVIANPEDQPTAIFVSSFDTAPLAPDADYTMNEEKKNFQKGLEALKVLANGKSVHLGYKKGTLLMSAMQGVEKHEVSGPHPAGNVGVLIHHVHPVNKGAVVWCVGAQDVASIGRVLSSGKFNVDRLITIAGPRCKNPVYYKATPGMSIKKLVSKHVDGDNVRVISGNPLTGEQICADGFLGYYDQQISLLEEGNQAKFFLTDGWLSPGLKKHSNSHAYPSWLIGRNKKYDLSTNLNGEERAFVVSGQYEEVFPFDIYPVQLIKSIMVNDIDKMEKLGIYEIAPEDFALCEYVCTSKINVQEIIRDGLDLLIAES